MVNDKNANDDLKVDVAELVVTDESDVNAQNVIDNSKVVNDVDEDDQTIDDKIRVECFREEQNLVALGMRFDHQVKILSSFAQRSDTRLESSFSFPGKYRCGHKISGNKPMIVYPFGEDMMTYNTLNTLENKTRFCFVLRELIKIEHHKVRIGIICFDQMDIKLFCGAIVAFDLSYTVCSPLHSREKRFVEDLTM